MKSIVLQNDFTKGQLIQFIQTLDVTRPFKFEWKLWKARRSNDANALYWVWMDTAAKYFSTKDQRFNKDDMHDLMRHKHLGYEEKIINRTRLQPQLKSTEKLDVNEMCFYMSRLDAWSASCGCLLPRPEDNDYSNWLEHHERQEA